jgi:hypothetical protein
MNTYKYNNHIDKQARSETVYIINLQRPNISATSILAHAVEVR